MTRRGPGAIWFAALYAVLWGVFLIHSACCWRASEDDAFFLDLSWNLLERGVLANDTYGPVMGHEKIVASIPPAFPVWQTAAVFLYRRTGSLMALKAAQLALLGVTLAALGWSLRARLPFGAALAGLAIAGTDGVLFNSVLSNRYEIWCVLVCLALLAAVEGVADRFRPAGGALFAGVAVLACLSNLQLLPLAAAAAVAVLVQPGTRGRRVALVAILAAFVMLAGVLLWVQPSWRDSFQRQVLGIADYYQPREVAGGAVWQRIRIGLGNLVAANAMNSAGSVVFLALGGGLLLGWRRAVVGRTSSSTAGPPAGPPAPALTGAHQGGGCGPGGPPHKDLPTLLSYSALFTGAIAGAFALGYVGPRLAPVFLLSLLMLATLWRSGLLSAMEWKAIAGAAVAVNYAGACLLQRYYLHAEAREVCLNYGLVPLLAFVAAVVLAGRVQPARLAAALTATVVAANLAINLGRDGYPFSRAVRQAGRDLAHSINEFERSAEAGAGHSPIVIYGDAPRHYLLARAIEQRWDRRIRFRTFFPYFYYVHPAFRQRFVETFQGTFVLLGPENRRRLESAGPSGAALRRVLAEEYREAGRFTTSLGETVVLVRNVSNAH